MTNARDEGAATRRPFALGAAAATACLLLLAVSPAPSQAADSPQIAPHQETVALLAKHGVRTSPDLDAPQVMTVGSRRPLTGTRTVLPVLAESTDDDGQVWLRVRLPGRVLKSKPPPRTGWISAASTRRSTTPWHIVVDVSARRVSVYRTGRRLHTYRAIVGKRSTPTPRGRYFVEENVRLPASHSGAPFALATSARSNVLQEFAGGPGQIALHGRRNVGGRLGTAVSHGCVRLSDRAIAWLARHVVPGVPVTLVS